jgi:hypothetical protein
MEPPVCRSCDIAMKKCVIWPFFMDYCEHCFTILVYHDNYGDEFKSCPLDILKDSIESCVNVRLPKLNASTGFDQGVYFSIYGVQKFCQKLNKGKPNTQSWGLSNVQDDNECYVCQIERGVSANVPESVVHVLNEEITRNVYDENVYKTLLIKSMICKHQFERALQA